MALNVRNVNQARISYSLGEPNDTQSSNTVIGLLKRIHSSSSLNGETINELIDEVDDLQETKADKSTTYTKTEVDNKLTLKADKSDTYTKTQVDNALLLKANSSDTYTKTQVYSKTEVDNALALKANQSTTYTKTEVNSNLALKADKSDTYTKTQVDNLISAGTITNYVTTDTLQSITGTKLCNELHADSFYAESILLKNHTFNGSSFKSNDQSDKNYKLCSEAYIKDLIYNKIEEKITYYDLDSYYIGSFNIHLKINNDDTWIETYGTAIIVTTDLNRLYITNLRLNVQTTTNSRIDLIEIIITKKSAAQEYYRPLNPSIKQGSGAGVCARNWQLTSCSSVFTLGYTGSNYESFIFWENPTTKTYTFSTAYWSFFLNGFMFDLYDKINDRYVYYP